MFPKMNRKARAKLYQGLVWLFLVVFVFSVAAASVIMLATPANPPGH